MSALMEFRERKTYREYQQTHRVFEFLLVWTQLKVENVSDNVGNKNSDYRSVLKLKRCLLSQKEKKSDFADSF